MKPKQRFAALFAALAALSGGCDNPSTPVVLDEDELIFIQAEADAPPLETMQRSFWAVAGENREAEIRYVPVPGYGDDEGEECLTFKVSGNSLLRHPDGRRVQRGDSVLITITVVDPDRFHFDFQPAGLQFDPDHPAELEVDYKWADDDYNGDGEEDEEDEDFEFGWWRQENPGEPWRRVGSVRLRDLNEVRADVNGFTGYALAGGSRSSRS
ncbi:MAG TPA: hypothetical protein VFQ45_04625 [Longimicrobium sp.]|nr:hypothetical protein [Longimicrobium sp.]